MDLRQFCVNPKGGPPRERKKNVKDAKVTA